MLSISDLSARYGRSVKALRGVSFEVPPSSVVAVLGSNGAGKTTLLRAISGTLPLHRGTVTGGSISFEGDRIDRSNTATIVRSGLVQVPEGRQVFGRMTVEENLRAGGLPVTAEARNKAKARVLELFPVLAERSKQAAGLLSGGEQQMLAIGRAMMSSPKLLLLDEPSLGLAPQMVTRIGSIVQEINATGTAVVLVEQNATMALRVASHAVVLEVGELQLQGPAAELAGSSEVQHLYLGGQADSDETAEEAIEAASQRRPRRTLGVWQG